MNPYQDRDKNLEALGYKAYSDYLGSKLWDSIRSVVLADKLCRCGRKANSLHHAAYDLETLRGDKLDFLVPCCNICHRRAERYARFIADPQERLQTVTVCLYSPSKPQKRQKRSKPQRFGNDVTWRVERALDKHLPTADDKKRLRRKQLRNPIAVKAFDPTPRLVKRP